jgi:formate dehydrogenase major subunit
MAMMVGKIGKPGCGVNPIRGQNNVQGACDMGAQPNTFTGYQKVADPAVVEKFEKAWGVELNKNVGRMATECFHDMIEGKLKGLFIFGEDPVVTDPDTNHVIKALTTVDFLVVDELFMTETAKYADVILPGRSYLEKEGTFSNTERRVQRVRKAIEIPGTKPDTEIFSLIMQRMGYNQPILTPAEIMDEIASVTPSFAGISHERLDSEEVAGRGLQWPCTSKEHAGTPIMHVGKFSRGRGYFYPAHYTPSTQQASEEYPLIMMTGRILYHYNACAMTGKQPEINDIASTSFIQINTKDAADLGIADGDKVYVSSPKGRIASVAEVGEIVKKGEVWMPFHFLDGNSNWLVGDHLDDFSKTPEYKVTAVKVEKAVSEMQCCQY